MTCCLSNFCLKLIENLDAHKTARVACAHVDGVAEGRSGSGGLGCEDIVVAEGALAQEGLGVCDMAAAALYATAATSTMTTTRAAAAAAAAAAGATCGGDAEEKGT